MGVFSSCASGPSAAASQAAEPHASASCAAGTAPVLQAETPTCVDCSATLTPDNSSALPAYCKGCFAAEAKLSSMGKLQHDIYKTCNLCMCTLSGDNKSPVVGVCWECYETESKLAALPAAPMVPSTKPSEAKTETCAGVDLVEDTVKQKHGDEGAPDKGWQKEPKESEANWFARIQMFRRGSQRRKQAEYAQQWKEFSEKKKQRFRSEIVSKVTPAPLLQPPAQKPWEILTESGRFLCLPEGYTVENLKQDFADTAENPSAFDERRWHMYALLHLLLQSGQCPFRSPAAAVEHLKELKVNKHQLHLVGFKWISFLSMTRPLCFLWFCCSVTSKLGSSNACLFKAQVQGEEHVLQRASSYGLPSYVPYGENTGAQLV